MHIFRLDFSYLSFFRSQFNSHSFATKTLILPFLLPDRVRLQAMAHVSLLEGE